MIIVRANARNATYISDDLITSGSVGIPVTFNLSEDFDGLSCIAVFEGSGVSIDVALMGDSCVVPHEVLATAGGYLRIGIYASNSEGTIVIPTVWAGSKMILQGAEPSEVDPSEPTPSWVAQVQAAAAEALANSEEAIEIAGGADAAAEEARQSASAAAASATAAGQSASVAGTAQAAAEAASGAAVSARDAAVAAQSGAESSASAAAGSATAAAGSAAAAAASEAAAREVEESIPQDYTDLSNDVSELKSQIDSIEAAISEETSVPVAGTVEIEAGIEFSARAQNCYIIFDQASENQPITTVKADVTKSENATYKFKLVEYVQTTGKGIYKASKVSDELTFPEPTGDRGVVTVTLDTPFVITAGHGLALVAKEVDLFGSRTEVVTSGYTEFILRSVTYDTLAVGTYLMNQTAIPTPNQRKVNFAVYNTTLALKEILSADEIEEIVNAKAEEVEATVDETIIDSIEESEAVTDNKYSLAPYSYVEGMLSGGEVVSDSIHRRITVDRYVYLKKGEKVFVGATERISLVARYYDNFEHYEQISQSSNEFVASVDGYYKWTVDMQYDISANITPYLKTENTYKGNVSRYNSEVVDAFNVVSVTKNPTILSNDTQLMSHVAMMDYDSSDKTMWVVYYANDATTAENNTDTRTYLTIKHFNPYTGEVLGSATFKVGDSIGEYTQANTPPYDPTITVLSNYVLVTFWANEDNERCISCFRVNKSTMALSNYAVNTLTYNGSTYDLNCTNLKAIYEAYSGTTISTIDTVSFSCHFPVYNGEYYGVINDIFSNSGYKSFLVKSTDLINWTIVHCFTEIPSTNEASIAIKNGIVYMADRNNGYMTKYNLSTNVVNFIKIPLAQMCKPCVYKMVEVSGNETVILADNIVAEYNSEVEGFRKNMGIYEINEDLSIKLKSRILTTYGCHYPDLASDGYDLFLLWSEDRRNLNRKLQRSDIGFSKILI